MHAESLCHARSATMLTMTGGNRLGKSLRLSGPGRARWLRWLEPDLTRQLTLRLLRNRSYQLTRHRSRRRDTPCQPLAAAAAAA